MQILRFCFAHPFALMLAGFFFFGTFFIMAMFYLIFGLGEDGPDMDYIKAHGVQIEAVYTGSQVNDSMSVNDVHPRKMTYRFEVDGKSMNDSFETLQVNKVNLLRHGQKIDIMYYDGDSYPLGYEAVDFPFYIVFVIQFVVMGMPGLVALVYLCVKVARKKKLYEYGTEIEARLVSVNKTFLGGPFLSTRYRVLYDFQLEGGNHVGCDVSSDVLLAHKQKGDVVRILVVEESPGLNGILDEYVMSRVSG